MQADPIAINPSLQQPQENLPQFPDLVGQSNPYAFFHRIDDLSLVEGNKTAGFTLVLSTKALLALLQVKVDDAMQLRVIEEAKARILRAKLLPKRSLKWVGIAFWKDTLVPRYLQGDPIFGGSIGADPETFGRLEEPDALERLGDEVNYTPHNMDTATMALALMVLAQTWAEYASSHLYLVASQAQRRAQAATPAHEAPPPGMKWFHCTTDVEEVSGQQFWRIAAVDLQDAKARFEQGDGEVIEQEIEVMSTGSPTGWRSK